jgi:ribonucleotide reductase beta subunit family protein with ferritin-like domain
MNDLTKTPLFNKDGDDSPENQRLINGTPAGISNLGENKFKWSTDLYRMMVGNFWVPQKVSLADDKTTINELTKEEDDAVKNTLSFLIFLDSFQCNNLPNIHEYITAPNVANLIIVQQYQEVVHCFAEGTEILTPSGWTDFKYLDNDSLVAQYNNDKTINFVKPTEIIESEYNGDMVRLSNTRYDTLITPNHRIVYMNQYNDYNLKIKEAKNVSVHNHRIPVAGYSNGEKKSLTEIDRLHIAYQADGYMCNNGNVTNDGIMYRWYVKKDRKKERLIDICKRGNFRYTHKPKNSSGYHTIYVWVDEMFDKEFDFVDLSNVSTNYCHEFIEEASYWDGCRSGNNIRYTNTNKKAIDKIMAIGTLGNYRVGIYECAGDKGFGKACDNPKQFYQLNFVMNDKPYINGRTIKKTIEHYDGKIYCVTVPSGMIVVRYNNRVTISGNSESYQYMLESLYPLMTRESIYNKWRDNPALLERIEYVASFGQKFKNEPTLENFKLIIVINLLLESLYFYQGFMLWDQLASRNKLTQSAKIIDYIRNDEMTHIGIFVNIIRELFNEEDKQMIIDMFKVAVEQEINWAHHVYGDNILGMSKKSSEQYVKFLANDRLSRVGIDPIYPEVTKNPYEHLEGKKRENFFETGAVTSYDRSESVGGWDDF